MLKLAAFCRCGWSLNVIRNSPTPADSVTASQANTAAVWGARHEDQSKPLQPYLAIEARAASIFAFTASRLKLAPFCIGGNSIAVIASFSTCC
jgi:hypothetical protein